ncbi:hypothetical protein GCM10011594_41890 [Nakamurella endophytica]|uniref:Calcineurin-like phosphoesterase domain-containing protein n=1 Tax=Nakamurella endophytica TaxID=1748367 RepID=A0A917TBB5_9ACTN|nr:hypothetical protein GCM10011594_41890 [Nakamurella endophytica]
MVLTALVTGPALPQAVAAAPRGPVADAAAPPAAGTKGAGPWTFAVIGDIPYGAAEIASFPQAVAQINADPEVRMVTHLGDIKNGSSVCSDDYFRAIKQDFDRFDDPFVYTIGDNEWTDCHRPNNGGYNPLERLAAVRSVFFPRPGRTLGRHAVAVCSQGAQGYPENVKYNRAGVDFAAVHIVGSNNSLAPWTGNTGPTPEQTAEVLGRTAAGIQLIRQTFSDARHRHDRAVVLMTQADMFDPTGTDPAFADYFAFQPIVQAIVQESRAFHGPVYLFNGDSHLYNADRPLAAGSAWLKFYGITASADNLQRITVDGSDNAHDYLRVTIQPRGTRVLDWQRIPFTNA